MSQLNPHPYITRRALIQALGVLGASAALGSSVALAGCSLQSGSSSVSSSAEASSSAVALDLELLKNTYTTWVGGAVGIMPLVLAGEGFDPSTLAYKSSNESVAKVGKDGALIGVAEGSADVTVTTADGKEMAAKVVVCPSRTDAKLVDDFYEYVRAQKIKELEAEGVAVTEGVDFVGNAICDQNVVKLVADYIDEVAAEVEQNGGTSPYAAGTSKDSIAALITVYREDGEAQLKKLTEGLSEFVAPANEAKTVDELMKWNAQVIADGNWGFWRNEVGPRAINEGNDPGLNIVLNPRLTPYFVLSKQSDYDNKEVYEALKSLVEGLLGACGETEEERAANAPKVIDTMKTLAREKTQADVMADESLSDSERDAELEKLGLWGGMYTADEVDELVPNIQYKKSLEAFDIGDTKITVTELGVITRLDAFVKEGDLDALRELLKVYVAYPYYIETQQGHVVNSAFLTAKNSVSAVAEHSSFIPAAESAADYSDFVLHRLKNTYGWEMAQAYIGDKLKGQSVESDLRTMIEQFIGEYKSAFERVEWMGDETRAAYIKKLDSMEYNLFGPDDFTGYVTGQDLSTAEEGGSLFSNVQKIYSGRWHAKSSWMGKEFLGAECYWVESYGMTTPDGEYSPMICNASYAPEANAIGIFAGIINDEVYKPGDTMFNYGRIGTVIAHELGHAFDLRGAGYDYRGTATSILTEEDAQKLQQKQDKVVKEFSTFSVVYEPETETVLYANGEFEAAEIMADLGGDEIVISIVKKEFPGEENMRALFESLALFWNSEQYDAAKLQMDYHPYGKLRGGVTPTMFDEFYDAFGIKEGDGMYLAPEYRERLWS